MKNHKQFATHEQRTAWQVECRHNADLRMLRRLTRELNQRTKKWAPPEQRRLAHEYRIARAAHVEEIRRQREERDTEASERARLAADELQMDLAW